MDIFRSLSLGGARFDKKRFRSDVEIFDPTIAKRATAADDQDDSRAQSSSNGSHVAVPRSLDFFGSAAKAGNLVKSSSKGKERAIDSPSSDASTKRKRSTIDDQETLSAATLPAFLKSHRIKLTGTDVPCPLTSWAELEIRWGVAGWLRTNLEKSGWGQPTDIQMGAMPVLLDNRDLLAGASTGSGKTLSFLLPLLHHLRSHSKDGFRAVIVSPTRELAQQIHEQLLKLADGRGFRFCVLTKTSEGALKQDPAMRKKYDVLITTPLRLVHAIEQDEIDLSTVQHIVLDEADRLLETGFLTQTDSILAACSHPHLRKALFSATLPAGVEEMAKTFMVDECRVIVGVKDGANEGVEQSVRFVGSEDGKLHALRSLMQEGKLKPPVLLFVQSIQRAQELFHELVYDGLHVDVMHSERPKAQREGVIEAFKRGDVWVLICTELMARGIDFKGVNLVINYDFPQSVQSYVHRVGRTGRAGRRGEAITFFTKDDAPYLKTVVNLMRSSGADVPQWLLDLPNPNKKARKALRRAAPERQDVRAAAGTSVSGRKEALRRRDMVNGSKRRKGTAQADGQRKAKVGEEGL